MKIMRTKKMRIKFTVLTVSPAAIIKSLNILTIISSDKCSDLIFCSKPFSELCISLLKIDIKRRAKNE